MIDQLDTQILEIIENATSLVRSITESEIENGVLFPSVTTIDIKRNLPSPINVEIIEGRLKALENEGYIYFVENRWWLTAKGRSILGKSSERTIQPIHHSKPMRRILEETFSKFESPIQEAKNAINLHKDYTELIYRTTLIEDLLSRLKLCFEIDILSENEYFKMVESLRIKLQELNAQIEKFIKDQKGQLIKEISELEQVLEKKKTQLENVNKIQFNE